MKKLYWILLFAIGLQSCILNSLLTEAPLIEEKNQKVFSAGISVPVPRFYSSYAYGLTDKFAIQSQVSASFFSYDFQQSFGYYKKVNDTYKWEFYFDYLYGNGTTFNLGGVSGAAGNYHIPSFRFNGGIKITTRTTVGFSIKSGYFFSKYDYWHDEYSATKDSLGEYPFEFVRYYDETAHALYIAPSLFFKFNLTRMQIGLSMQLQSLYHFQSRDFSILPFSIGLTYQNKKTSKTDIDDFIASKKALYESKNNVSIRFSPSFNNYPNKYVSNSYYNTSYWLSLPLYFGYERNVNHWFSIYSSVYYFTKKGTFKYIDKNDVKQKTEYRLHDFKISFEPRLHYYFSEKLDIYSGLKLIFGFSYSDLKTSVIQTAGAEIHENNSTVLFQNWPFAVCLIGVKHYFFNDYGLSAEYVYHNEWSARNFYLGLHKKF